MTFHLVDAILFLNIRVCLDQFFVAALIFSRLLVIILSCYDQALLSAVVKRIKGFIKLKIALGTLHEALPDAAPEEIQAYDDECAICRASVMFIIFLYFCSLFFALKFL